GLVDDGEVVALQLDDIQLGDDLAPAAVRRNITISRFQLDCTIVHPLGAEEGDGHLDGRPGVEVQDSRLRLSTTLARWCSSTPAGSPRLAASGDCSISWNIASMTSSPCRSSSSCGTSISKP